MRAAYEATYGERHRRGALQARALSGDAEAQRELEALERAGPQRQQATAGRSEDMIEHVMYFFHDYDLIWRGMKEGFFFIGVAVVLMLIFGRPVSRA